MENLRKIKEWRAEEIAKIYLFKNKYQLRVESYPTPLFDLFVTLKDNTEVRFAVEVKTHLSFKANLNKHLTQLKIYRDSDMINIPVLIFKIDDSTEKGELDFLVIPSFNENKLLIRNEFKFLELNQENLTSKIDVVIKWFERSKKR